MNFASRSRNLKSIWQGFASGLLSLVLCSWPLASWSSAAPSIVDTDGFETGFNLGVLEGQAGWVKSSFSPNGSTGTDTSAATIQGGVVESGTKSLKVEKSANFDSRWLRPVGTLGFPTHRYVLIDWDMNVTFSGADPDVIGPFLGVDTYDDTVSPRVLGSLGVNATTGEVLYQDPERGGGLFETGALVTFGQWYHFQIILDFALDQYQVLLDQTVLLSTDFVDGPADTFTDADIAAFAAGMDVGSQNQTATAYFDNFLVRNVARADFDIDGNVDDDDLAIWEGAFGATLAADADLDGDSDGSDFLIWQREFDNGALPLTAPVSQVPEPSSFILILFMLFMALLPSGKCVRWGIY